MYDVVQWYLIMFVPTYYCFWYLFDNFSYSIHYIPNTAELSNLYRFRIYSVVQSDGNSFCGDVVLDSFNMAYRDKNSILDQNMKSKYFGIFIMKILNFKSDGGNCIFKEIVHITTINSKNWVLVLLLC